MAGLTIYKASAGSGKTYTITREYIHLLFADSDNYKYILGVTFTNKATAEMKWRIIAELDKLANSRKCDYSEGLLRIFKLNPIELRNRAQIILSKILHDFSHFNILTIDSFFQRIIRAFAREIGFYQGFDIELDQDKVLTAAADEMIFSLDSNPILKDWLVRFAEDKIVEGSTWDVNRDIIRIGKEVFKESFKDFSDSLLKKITNKEFLDEFNDKLAHIRTEFENILKQKSISAMQIVHQHQLYKDDFKGKSNSIGAFFEKLGKIRKFDKWEISQTIRSHYNDIDKWTLKNSPKTNDINSAYHAGLNTILGEVLELYDSNISLYLSAIAVQKHLYVLGVVADLLIHIRSFTQDRNLFMISDTSQFLQKLISGTDAPFIYERTGTFIKYYMIDEFQDTSALQWNNFKPLVVNSLAENNPNWVVGDVKQSIYRWRNSDWTILSDKIITDLLPHPVHVENLDYNWRSSCNIIRFNNSFFEGAINVLLNEADAESVGSGSGVDEFKQLLVSAYSNFAQLVPSHKNIDRGLVSIQFVPNSGDEEIQFSNEVLSKIPALLEKFQDNGYQLKDIAILVRTRAEGSTVSEFLLKYQELKRDSGYRYDILSSDSLLLRNSESVKWIISALTYISCPTDSLNKSYLFYAFDTYLFGKEAVKTQLHNAFVTESNEQLHEKMAGFFTSKTLKQYPVYELCDMLIEHFGLNQLTQELPFLQAFQDMLQEYSRKEPADLISFLRWWEENQDKRVISTPEGQDAIRLMTIHTAKGLEFKIVLMPFAEWDFLKSGLNSNILWCNTQADPFNSLGLLPVSITKQLKNTVFSSNYFREKALSYIDNLNLLYVAFTRAVDALYVFVPYLEKEGVENNIANLIAQSINMNTADSVKKEYPVVRLNSYFDKKDLKFEFGTLPIANNSKESTNEILMDQIAYTVRKLDSVAKQVISANDYFKEGDEILSSKIGTGKIMHEIFQQIKTSEDIESALLHLFHEGKIAAKDVSALKEKIEELINQKPVNEWFVPGLKVLTEASVLLCDGTVHRPDRVIVNDKKAVVIDYKFGNNESKAHQRQVNEYIQYIKQMGFIEVEGFLWYVTLQKVVPVNATMVQGSLWPK